MYIRATANYHDKARDKDIRRGDVYQVGPERGAVILATGWAEEVQVLTPAELANLISPEAEQAAKTEPEQPEAKPRRATKKAAQ